ncbi:hypothetical protein [Egicoccus halophilus]|uniref:Uncharacterized protein n=1 Tax=Egicoccus halophilus TaxID=1670830 RepID=A0A8J3AH65_9ACTN|nr:hypothetical protein [Egicoccus halophilus]GGI09670.1 hypothetical protein GCM10011354_35230 [Egicoccus halophilus]
MATGPTLSRRQLLGGALVLTAATLPAVGRVVLDAPAGGPDPLANRLLTLFDRNALRPLGRAVLGELPPGTTSSSLARQLVPGVGSVAAADRVPDEVLLDALAAEVAHEYEVGRVRLVEGWLLADTEARLCALAALT